MEDNDTTKRQVITPSEAQEIETHELYYDQRPINQARVRKYGTAMKLGGWLPRSVLSFCVTPDGQRFLVNGRRRINAVIWANVPIEFDVQRLPVANVEEIGTWYAHFDDHDRRSLDERMKAFHAEARCNFNKAQTKHLRACYPLILPGFRAAAETQGHIAIDADSPELRLAFIEAWADEATRYYADTKGSRHKITTNLRRSPIEAVALVTYRHTGNDAEEFWHQVAHDDGLGEFDPRKKLHVFLGSTMSGEYSPDEMARYAASAWCAWWDERTLQTLRAQSTKNPLTLGGTPHDGKHWLNYITSKGVLLEMPEPDGARESSTQNRQENLPLRGET